MAPVATDSLISPRDPVRAGEQLIRILLPATLALLFFVTGYFEFFSLMGVGLELQVALMAVIMVSSPPIMFSRVVRFIREPLFLLSAALFIVELLVRRASMAATLGMAAATLLVALAFALGPRYANRTLRLVAAVATIYAIMAIVQFAVLAVAPELVERTINPNNVLLEFTTDPFRPFEITPVTVDLTLWDPLALLGMTTGREFVFGREVVRVFSFVREPGLLVVYFLLPGILVLTWRGRVRWLALPLLLASLLGFSGTVFASVAFGFMLFLLGMIVARRHRAAVLTWVPLLVVVGGTLLLYRTSVFDAILYGAFRSPLTPLRFQVVQFLDFYEPAMFRLTQAREFAAAIEIGRAEGIPGAIGLLAYGYVKAHLLGVLLITMFLHEMFRAIARCWGRTCPALAAALLAGIFVQAGFFQQYGFTTPAAFLISALIILRLRDLDPRGATREMRNPTMPGGRGP